MAKSKHLQKSKPVYLSYTLHKTIKEIALLCDLTIEKIVNMLLEDDVKDRERLRKVLLELETNPECIDRIFSD